MRRTPVDSLLVNANLHDGHLSGLKAVSEIHASQPLLPIIVLCDQAPDELVLSSFRAGARGLLCRSESIGMLCKCIQAVYKGQIWASSSHLQVLLGALVQAPPARVVSAQGLNLLAEREGQVVSLVADGLTNRDIASRLGLSEHTVSNYLFRVYNKLGLSNRVELVLYVMRQREQSRIAG
jgi:DNA-binding NarL/FixJ family response regulator